MSTTLPEAPAAPDYAKANQEGIFADIDTLGTRRAIEQGARLGNVVTYTDPRTGETRTADFTGLGDAAYAQQAATLAASTNAEVQRQQLALRQELGVKNAEETAKEIAATDPLAYKTRQDLTGKLDAQLNAPKSNIGANAGVLNSADQIGQLANLAPQTDNRLGNLYGEANRNLSTNVDDAGANRTLRGLQGLAATRLGTQADDMGTVDMLGALQGEAAQRLGSGADDATARSRLSSIYDEATRLPGAVDDPSNRVLNESLQRASDDYARGGELDPDVKRDLLNEVRSGQVARGNFLGDAAAVTEATELGSAMEQRKAQRLQTLLDVQNRAFGQNAALRGESTANQSNRLATLAGLQGQGYGQEQGLREEDRSSAGQQINTLAQLAQQLYGTGSAMRGENQQSTTNQVNTLAQLAQQLYGNSQGLRSEQRAAETTRLGALSGLAGQDFGQQQQAYQTAMNAQGQAMAANQAASAEQRTTRQENFGRDQQALANASAMVLGQPITNQFGSLGAAQQGSVGFNPIAYQGGTQLNANAGNQAAQFAQQSFGTNANMWTTAANIAQQDNAGKMSMISGLAGGAMGMI